MLKYVALFIAIRGMLPDFPTIKMQFAAAAQQFEKATKNTAPFFSEARRSYHLEGDKYRKYPERLLGDDSGKSSYALIERWFGSNTENVKAYGHLHWAIFIPNLVKQMIEDELQYHFNILAEAALRIRRVTNGKKGATIAQRCLDGLQDMNVEFDAYGNPYLPSAVDLSITRMLVWYPELREYYEDKLNSWKKDPKYRAQYEEVIERKRKDWIDRESNRKLVD